MKDDRGFTLIELIAVMMIMAIVTVGSITGLKLAGAGSAKNASRRVLAALDYVQMQNMTKIKSYKVEIIQDAATGKYKLNIVSWDASGNNLVESSTDLNLRNGQITFKYSGNSTIYTVDSTNEIQIRFQKDTGGLKKFDLNPVISEIGITSAGRTYDIHLVTATGKHYIE